ncbi:MAG: DUF1320 family protein [Phycisphaerales bacterium]|nr:DUF1320 family protein [Phycisphaerales bacterium]
MAYAEIDDLKDRLGLTVYARLTDRDDGAVADNGVASDIIAEAETLLDSYLAQRYATPVDLVAHPELAITLKARTLDLSEWIAWRTSPFVTDIPARVQMLGEAAMGWLRDVATARVTLPAASAPAAPTSHDEGPRYSAEPRQFTADELDGL